MTWQSSIVGGVIFLIVVIGYERKNLITRLVSQEQISNGKFDILMKSFTDILLFILINLLIFTMVGIVTYQNALTSNSLDSLVSNYEVIRLFITVFDFLFIASWFYNFLFLVYDAITKSGEDMMYGKSSNPRR